MLKEFIMQDGTKSEQLNNEVLNDLFEVVVRTLDYISVKNSDTKLISAITGNKTNGAEENIQLSLDVVSSIISKQIRNKFKL